MEYKSVQKGIFLERPNRFLAKVKLKDEIAECHVKNTGRCRELLLPNAEVYVQREENPKRKTKYSLIHVKKGERLINLDSQAPNRLAGEWLPQSGLLPEKCILIPEKKHGNSRFDFYFSGEGRTGYVEVKGVTLENDNVVSFPDAPTQRGTKHLLELIGCKKEGLEAAVLFVVQMTSVSYFTPNRINDPAFAQALEEAAAAGVKILAVDCLVTPNLVTIHRPVEVRLSQRERLSQK